LRGENGVKDEQGDSHHHRSAGLAHAVDLGCGDHVFDPGRDHHLLQLQEIDTGSLIAEAGAQSTANWLVYNYTAPTTFGSYDMTQSPFNTTASPLYFPH
jgi:hypothetical protein